MLDIVGIELMVCLGGGGCKSGVGLGLVLYILTYASVIPSFP